MKMVRINLFRANSYELESRICRGRRSARSRLCHDIKCRRSLIVYAVIQVNGISPTFTRSQSDGRNPGKRFCESNSVMSRRCVRNGESRSSRIRDARIRNDAADDCEIGLGICRDCRRICFANLKGVAAGRYGHICSRRKQHGVSQTIETLDHLATGNVGRIHGICRQVAIGDGVARQLRVHNRAIRDRGGDGGELGIRIGHHLNPWCEGLRDAGIGHGDVQIACRAVERARTEIQIHRKQAVDQRGRIGDRTANLVAGTDGVVKLENHHVSAVGIRAVVPELALIGERRGALGGRLMDAGKQRKRDKKILEFAFHTELRLPHCDDVRFLLKSFYHSDKEIATQKRRHLFDEGKHRLSPTNGRFVQATCATNCFVIFALAHAAGANSLIWVILAAGKSVNKSFR